MRKESTDFWKEDISFYFDGVGFVHHSRPKQHALACRGKVWRKHGEGLSLNCTSKGQTESNGGKQIKNFVAISHNCGVICAEQYEKLSGATFADFITRNFGKLFQRSGKNTTKWLQDGDPFQNSAAAKKAMENMEATLVLIPPRSPDLNPIENVFAFVKKELKMQVIDNNIEKETIQQFSLRVKATLYSSRVQLINKVIESMGTRLSRIIVRKGGRIEY